MKTYSIKDGWGRIVWGIDSFADGTYRVFGNKHFAQQRFKKIGRKPPNEYGNFYGREKAGAVACQSLIEMWDELQAAYSKFENTN